MSADLAPALASIVEKSVSPGERLDVVLELEQPEPPLAGSRAERIAHQKARFEVLAEPVRSCVRRQHRSRSMDQRRHPGSRPGHRAQRPA